MFKVGDKVVYIGEKIHPMMSYPSGVVTIVSVSKIHVNSYVLSGFEFAPNGVAQSFRGEDLRKLDYDFAESVLENIKEQVLQE